MRRDIPEARNLLVLRRQVHDRVEDEVGERERVVDRRRRKVADRHADRVGAGLRLEPRNHCLREVDAMYPNPAGREGQRDAAGADTELECRAAPGQARQEVDDRVDDRRREYLRVLVIAGGDTLTEEIVGHRCTLPAPSFTLART